ncbi:phosphoribosylanthranilate isomerase [Lachnospiraceae bacterium YSD2013]|nr:phosphoribosylanthranilate isomerase [Lachnospiraceae bacterium YSD2013]
MTEIKLCGLRRPLDIVAANGLKPEYIGFVFARKSKRYVEPEKAMELKQLLLPDIKAVGVFVNEELSVVADLLNKGVIDVAQLHGSESEEYVAELKKATGKPVIRAFKVAAAEDVVAAVTSSADYILLDAGAGDGVTFDWSIVKDVKRPFFLAGGLNPGNVADAVAAVQPYAVDVSSGIETDGFKDIDKMTAFVKAVRKD